jgi:L-rhamnose mutarotase
MPQAGGARSRLRQAGAATYCSWHRPELFPVEMTDLVKCSGFTRYVIYREGSDLFAYFEADDISEATALMRTDPICVAWLAKLAPLMDAPDPMDPWRPLEVAFSLQ